MPVNLFSYGENALTQLRPVMSFSVVIERDGVPQANGPFNATSPPIGHALLAEIGIELSQHERFWFWDMLHLDRAPDFFQDYPMAGDILIDQTDGSRWRILPQDDGTASWRYHGQLRGMIHCKTVLEEF